MCGIAGIITKNKSGFDYSTFCHLGIANDSRGGDSCGIFIDGKYEYGVDDHKLFADFFTSSKLLRETFESSIALLHCRKASVGLINQQNAQPVIIKDTEGNVKFVLIHNGTILNYHELAEKYIPNIDVVGMTDSQVMARIFYHAGYKVLDEYYGGGVFVMVDYRDAEPTVYLFKGASATSSYTKDVTEERPLFYSFDADREELVFSSLWPHLYASRSWVNCESLKPNILFKFTGKDLAPEAVYERSKVAQRQPVVYTVPVQKTNSSVNHYKSDYNYYYYMYGSPYTMKYRIGGELCQGLYHIAKDTGLICKKSSNKTIEAWFFHGVHVKDFKAYEALKKMQEASGMADFEFDEHLGSKLFTYTDEKLFVKAGLIYKIDKDKEVPYTGKIKMLGSTYVYEIFNGHIGPYCD